MLWGPRERARRAERDCRLILHQKEGPLILRVLSGLGILCFLAGKMRMSDGGWF